MIFRIPWALFTTVSLVLAVTLTVSRGQDRPSSVPEPGVPQPISTNSSIPEPGLPVTSASEPVMPESSATESAARELDPSQRDAMAEILRIRRRQGDLLAGSIFAESAEGQQGWAGPADDPNGFAEALKRVMQRAEPSAHPEALRKPPGDSELTRQCEEAYQWIAHPDGPRVFEDSPLTKALRRAARLLDRRADSLEDEREFGEADRLRDLADQLRIEARSGESPLVATPADIELPR